jgi:hypothetical protein
VNKVRHQIKTWNIVKGDLVEIINGPNAGQRVRALYLFPLRSQVLSSIFPLRLSPGKRGESVEAQKPFDCGRMCDAHAPHSVSMGERAGVFSFAFLLGGGAYIFVSFSFMISYDMNLCAVEKTDNRAGQFKCPVLSIIQM